MLFSSTFEQNLLASVVPWCPPPKVCWPRSAAPFVPKRPAAPESSESARPEPGRKTKKTAWQRLLGGGGRTEKIHLDTFGSGGKRLKH